MKTILVTGATGFLGKHLVEQLKEAEPETRLRLLCRGAPAPGDDRTEIVKGDITSRDDVVRAAGGAAEIYHLAGFVDRNPANPWPLYQTHVEGTRNVCEAARESGANRIVVVSSSGTVAVSRQPVLHTEQSPYTNEVVAQWPYYLSKIYAEKLAFWYVEHQKVPIVVVNPSLLLGPGDERQSSTHDIVLFLKGQIAVVPCGGLNLVDARDVAAALIAAMHRGTVGERYLLGGPNWTFRAWIDRVSSITGIKAPAVSLPVGVSLFGARAARRVLPLLGRTFELDDASIGMSNLYWYCDSSKAQRELGFQTRDPMTTLRDTIDDIHRSHPHLRK